MRQIFATLGVLMGCWVGTAVALDQKAAFVVHDLRVTPALAGGMTAVSGVFENTGQTEIEIINVQSSIASAGLFVYVPNAQTGLVEQQARSVINVAPGAQVVLSPGNIELRLSQLTQALEAGQEIPLQLVFRDGTFRNVRARVSGIAPTEGAKAEGELLIVPVRATPTEVRPAWLMREVNEGKQREP